MNYLWPCFSQRISSHAKTVGSGTEVRETCKLISCTTVLADRSKGSQLPRHRTSPKTPMLMRECALSPSVTRVVPVLAHWRSTWGHTVVSPTSLSPPLSLALFHSLYNSLSFTVFLLLFFYFSHLHFSATLSLSISQSIFQYFQIINE